MATVRTLSIDLIRFTQLGDGRASLCKMANILREFTSLAALKLRYFYPSRGEAFEEATEFDQTYLPTLAHLPHLRNLTLVGALNTLAHPLAAYWTARGRFPSLVRLELRAKEEPDSYALRQASHLARRNHVPSYKIVQALNADRMKKAVPLLLRLPSLRHLIVGCDEPDDKAELAFRAAVARRNATGIHEPIELELVASQEGLAESDGEWMGLAIRGARRPPGTADRDSDA